MPQNQKDLTDFMKEEWDVIPESILINLIKSMRRRCELVIIIENNGERILLRLVVLMVWESQ